VGEMKRNVYVVRFKFRCNILISGKIIKEMPGSVASGTLYIWWISFALHPHCGLNMHFVSISDVAKAWDNVYGVYGV